MDSKTVKQIATELGTNKNVIYRIIQKNKLQPIPEETSEQGRKNATRYSLEDFAIIKTEFIRLQDSRKATPEESQDNKSVNSREDLQSLIESQRATIETLERELETSKQTERELRELLANQMELLKQTQEMNSTLTDTIRREQEIRAIQTLAIETKNKPKLLERISSIFHPNKQTEQTKENDV